MAESLNPISSNIIRQIIKKSLFTERQIEIILNQLNPHKTQFTISKGAYFRQVRQSRDKLIGLYYSIILLRGLGILVPEDIDVISELSEQVSMIQSSDVFPEKEEEIMFVIGELVNRACRV
ncbi:MAG: hypothetical protein HY222_05230 [Thaumarchaeota archaeon]|nr:hypothetical protein [Nitrososphaerota archaeon]MBI3641779.1 hypothetical protein [Nitrososphaerota archaeon]